MLMVPAINLDSFKVEVTNSENQVTLTLSGTGDAVACEPLKRCLTALRMDTSRLGLDEVCIDIRALYLLNSSCIKELVRFIYLAQSGKSVAPIVFVVDPNLGWQTRALTPLTRMAPELVRIRN